jgi:hypothetical protein
MRQWMRSSVLGGCLVAAAIAIVGCGSSGATSTGPSFCSSLTTLKTSVKALPTTDVIKNGTNALKTATDTVVKNAHQVVDAAKHDFPNETEAITTSVNALQKTVKDIEPSASPALVAQAVGNAASVTLAVKNFASSASPKCE